MLALIYIFTNTHPYFLYTEDVYSLPVKNVNHNCVVSHNISHYVHTHFHTTANRIKIPTCGMMIFGVGIVHLHFLIAIVIPNTSNIYTATKF